MHHSLKTSYTLVRLGSATLGLVRSQDCPLSCRMKKKKMMMMMKSRGREGEGAECSPECALLLSDAVVTETCPSDSSPTTSRFVPPMVSCLEYTFGIHSTALAQFKSYLYDRFQKVSVNNMQSDPVKLSCDVLKVLSWGLSSSPSTLPL